MNRYQRQQQVPQLGADSQQALAQARVLIIGVGGLGSPVASLLARAGVGKLTLVDVDRVDLSNLHRQTLFCEADVGKSKVWAAQARLQAINSEIQIEAIEHTLDPSNVEDLVSAHTVVVDAADSFFTSYLLSDTCFKHRIPLVSASVLQTSGYVGVFCGTEGQPAPSMRAIFPAPPLSAQTCSTAGVTGPSVVVIGGLQAQEVLKVIVQDSSQLLAKLMYLDLWEYSQNIVDFNNATEPQRFAKLVLESSNMEGDICLDVRTRLEVQEAPRLGKTLNIPIDELGTRATEIPKSSRIICVCKSGQRALNAAHQLIELGFNDVLVTV